MMSDFSHVLEHVTYPPHFYTQLLLFFDKFQIFDVGP